MTVDLRAYIRDVPDFPKAGIVFKDITPLLRAPEALNETIEQLAAPFRDQRISSVVSIESRGFIFGACVAQQLHAGFIPVRKPGKLPWTTRRHEYVLEYGSDVLEIHDDALAEHDRVLIVDDVLATGGTMHAAVQLVRGFGAEIVSVLTVIELGFLEGRRKLGDVPIHTVLHY